MVLEKQKRYRKRPKTNIEKIKNNSGYSSRNEHNKIEQEVIKILQNQLVILV